MKEIISETLWESSEKIFRRKDTVSAMLCVPGLIFFKHMSHAFEQPVPQCGLFSQQSKQNSKKIEGVKDVIKQN